MPGHTLLKVMAVSPLLLALVPWRPTRLGCSVRQGVATLLLGTILARWTLAMTRQSLVHRHARQQLQPVPSDRPAQERFCSAGAWSCACNMRVACQVLEAGTSPILLTRSLHSARIRQLSRVIRRCAPFRCSAVLWYISLTPFPASRAGA